MKKVFKIVVDNKSVDRQVDSIKNEIRKYIKREKNKTLTDGFNFWHFDCMAGKNENEAKEIDFKELIKYVDYAKSENYESFYIQILAKAIKKEKITVKNENLEQ